MAAMASMMISAPAGLNFGAVRRKSLGHNTTLPHTARLQLKCMAKAGAGKDPKEASATTDQKVSSTRFSDLFAFSGPAPELINGRAAMLGFVAAIGVEAASGRDLLSQVSEGGVSWFLIAVGMLTAASVVPLFKGVSAESKSQPFFSSSAEMWNGRFAMLGLLALAFTEYVKGGPLV